MEKQGVSQSKHPCQSCVYFIQCGSATRTDPCNGRTTKKDLDKNMYVCKFTKKGKVGEVSSKYGYDRDGSQFEADIKAHQEHYAALYESFVEWMKTKDVTPETFRQMFTRYYEEFLE